MVSQINVFFLIVNLIVADSGLDLLCSQVVFVVGQEEIYGKMKDNVCRFQLEVQSFILL